MSQTNRDINPRVSNPSAATLSDLGTYDLARWKPLSADRFLEEMVAMSMDLQEEIVVTTTHLADGRVRLAYFTDLVERGAGGKTTNDAYLIILSDPQDNRSRPMAFVRTDMDLDLGDDVGNS